MDKEQLLLLLKELFEEERIEIEYDTHDEWEVRYADIYVRIDGKQVYHKETNIGDSGWTDY